MQTPFVTEPKMCTSIRSIRFLAVLLLSLWCQGAVPAAAQSEPPVWYKTSILSDTPQNSESPAIIADGLGYVHLFWDEDFGGEPFEPEVNPHAGNSIFYRRWDGVSWTSPVDILSVPGEAIAAFVAADVDRDNRLHVVWTGQTDFYYSNAPAWQAESAHAWSQPRVVATDSARSKSESAIVADAAGHVHILYATRGDEPGIYHIRSDDVGVTWGPATELSGPFDRLERSFSNVQVITDGAGRLHAVWQTNEKAGYGQAVYYARSLDEGQTWSAPVQLGYRDPGDFEASYPYLVSTSDSELHLIYLDGWHRGRSHRISHDGGETWSEPMHILPDLEGVTGYVFPLVDGSGQMHLIINMRTVEQVGGMYYARWTGSSWTPVQAFIKPGDPNLGAAHYTAGTVRLGNELHVVWQLLDKGEIGHIYGVVPSVPQATPSLAPSLQAPTPSPSPTPGLRSTPINPQSIQPAVNPAPAALETGITARAVWFGFGLPFLAVLILVGLILVRARQKR